MTQTSVRVQLQQRVSTDSEWSSANPVLLLGEVGHNSTNKQYKLGDGSTQWNSLAYAGASVPTTITVADESTDTSCNVAFFTGATGDLAPKTGTNLTFNSNTGALTATSFVGALTGNASGSSGSCTGNAATATAASGLTGSPNITVGTIGCGNITGTGTVSDSKGDVRTIVQISKSAQHTIVAADSGKHSINSTGGWIINTSTGFTAGQAITLINNSGSDQTITNTGCTMYLANDTSAKSSLTLKGRGMATFICTASNVYYGSGAGLE